MEDVTNSNSKTKEENNKSDSDYLEATIGQIGIWQICVCLAASCSRCIALGNLTLIVFLTPATEFICTEFRNNITIVAEKMTCYESCVKYEYNSSAMEETIISDFQLICDRQWLASFAQSILMFGVLIGVSFFGWISDRFGRRVGLISSSIFSLVSMILSAFAPNYWVFITLRLMTGIATGGPLIICYPIVMEVSSRKYRALAGALVVLPGCFLDAALALLAYYFPTWKLLTLGFSILYVLILMLVFIIPESPRWLLSKGKVDDAICVITRAAKWNKLSTDHIRDTVVKNYEALGIKENDNTSASYLDLFTNKSLRKITLTTLIIWTMTGSMIFGLYQYMTFLSSNIYLTVIIIGLIQIPVFVIQLLLTKYFGRKSAIIGLLTISGMAYLILIFTSKDNWCSSFLGVIGFSACCVGFGITFVYHGELYPTPLRNMALGLASAVNKLGAMTSAFIASITPVWIPSLIFAMMAFVAAAFCFLLPETKERNLKDTLD